MNWTTNKGYILRKPDIVSRGWQGGIHSSWNTEFLWKDGRIEYDYSIRY